MGGGRSALVVEEVVAGRRGEAGITTLAVQAFTDAFEDGFHHVFLLWFAVIAAISVRR